MLVRRFKKEDAIKASNVIKKTLLTTNKKDYPKKTIDALIFFNKPKKLIERSKITKLFVAVDKDVILGIGGYEDDHLQCFFVNPSFHKKGIGQKIFDRVIKDMTKEGYKKIYSNSTRYAEKFYEKNGFKKIKKETSPFLDTKITYIVMFKKL